MMPEYRLTRPFLYQGADCAGRTNLAARQGHYITAADATTAGDELRKTFPDERFDVQYWSPGIKENGMWVVRKGAYIGVV